MNRSLVSFSCNGASDGTLTDPRPLEYRAEYPARNVNISLAPFVRDLFHIPPRTLDLLELAAYTYAADRLVRRGRRRAVEFHSWSRRIHLRTKVRDLEFWQRSDVRDVLSKCLGFMTGDAEFSFSFEGGHATPPTSLFDKKDFEYPTESKPTEVTLFSGGLDSLSGVMRTLARTDRSLVLVSHHGQPGVKGVQKGLSEALAKRHPDRVHHYGFTCTFSGVRANEETQRSRSFLYTSIGFAICQALRSPTLTVYENGVTSLNLRRREDLANARASRTTHPRAIADLQRFLRLVADDGAFRIATPFLWNTKRAVVETLVQSNGGDLIASSVSCTRTFQRSPNATHCGQCFQCLDRRMAMFAGGFNDLDDPGLYAVDIIRAPIPEGESRTAAVDYVRQAASFAGSTAGSFAEEYLSELAALGAEVPGVTNDIELTERVWKLVSTHGENVRHGIRKMQELYDDPLGDLAPESLLGLVASREHQRPPAIRLADAITRIVEDAVGTLFGVQRPANERDLNSKLAALIGSHSALTSEHPTVSFACAGVAPDHTVTDSDLLIEAKYVRGNTPPSKASEGIAADLTKYPARAHILFIVYDPDRRITNDHRFARDFESLGRCSILVVR